MQTTASKRQAKRRKPKKPKRLRNAQKPVKNVEEVSNTLLAPSSLKKGFKNKNTASTEVNTTNTSVSPSKRSTQVKPLNNNLQSVPANTSDVEPPLPALHKPTTETSLLNPKKSTVKSNKRKTLSLVGLGSKTKDRSVGQLSSPKSTRKRSRKPKKPKRARLNQATVNNALNNVLAPSKSKTKQRSQQSLGTTLSKVEKQEEVTENAPVAQAKDIVLAPKKVSKENIPPAPRKPDLNKTASLPKKSKKPKRERTRNTLLKDTVTGLFKRRSSKRKTEIDEIENEKEDIKEKIVNKQDPQINDDTDEAPPPMPARTEQPMKPIKYTKSQNNNTGRKTKASENKQSKPGFFIPKYAVKEKEEKKEPLVEEETKPAFFIPTYGKKAKEEEMEKLAPPEEEAKPSFFIPTYAAKPKEEEAKEVEMKPKQRKVKKPKRARNRNTLLKSTMGMFKRRSDKRKTEIDQGEAEKAVLKEQLSNKPEKEEKKTSVVPTVVETPAIMPLKVKEKPKKVKPVAKHKTEKQATTEKKQKKVKSVKRSAPPKIQEDEPPMPPRVEEVKPQLKKSVKSVSPIHKEEPPMPPRVEPPKVPRKVKSRKEKESIEDIPPPMPTRTDDAPPMPARVEPPAVPRKVKSKKETQKKKSKKPKSRRIVVEPDSPPVPKKVKSINVEDVPPMPARIEPPAVPKKEKSIKETKNRKTKKPKSERIAVEPGSPPVPKKVKSIKVEQITPTIPIPNTEIKQPKNTVDNVLAPSKSSRKPNSGKSSSKGKSSKELKSEFQAKDKFRQSFWLNRGNKKPKDKKVRASLALLRTGGKLKPLNFNTKEKSKKNSPIEDLKSQYQKSDKFRASFWTRKNTKKPKKKAEPRAKLNANLKQFAGLLENTLNKKPGEKEEVDVGQLDVNQGLLTSEVKTGDDGKIDYSPYMKMAKLRIPEGAIRQKMFRDKLTDEQIDYFFTNVKDQPEKLEAPKEDEAGTAQPQGDATIKLLEKAGDVDYKKYITLAKNKMPEPVIVGAMTRDGLSADNQEFFLANMNNLDLIKPPETRYPKLKLEEQRGDWDYSKYKKMVKIKVPEMVIKRDMANDGLSEENIEFFYANIDQLSLLKSEEEEVAEAKPQAAFKPSFLSDIEGLKKGNNLLKKSATAPPRRAPEPKKSTLKKSSEPGLLSELKKRMQTIKRGTSVQDL